MCVLPTSWVVYFLAGLTFLLTWLFFALLNITSPILAHHHHDNHQNQRSHLDHCQRISQSHADTLLLVNASIFGYNIKAILTTMITMATLKPRCWPRCCSSLTSQGGPEQSLVGSSLAF